MSRIDELIAELAPDGVEFKAVGEITARSSNIKWAMAGDAEFQYIDLSSVDRVSHRIGETASITADNAPSRAQQIVHTGDVIFATTRPAQMRWAVIPLEYEGQIASTGYCVLRPDTSVVLTNFLAHLLGTGAFRQYVEANQVAGNYPSIPDNRVRAYRIPVPPLEVQREIVRVLDQFTQLEAELEAELEARRAQYDYYAGELLAVDQDIPRVKFGDVATIVRGASPRPIQQFLTDDPFGAPWIKIGDVPADGKYITRTGQRVTLAGAAKSRRVMPGDFVLSNSMSFGRPYISKIEGYIHDGWLAISDFEDSYVADYLYYLLRSAPVQDEFNRRAGAGTVQNLNADIVRSVEIPLPPRDVQERVVTLLDRFDALVNDLSVGLPAELAARRKQYEYYRDKLLTFKELPA
ncbi:MAG: restriction endonuclease subunit S [Microbacteriaceae bacterium]|nr:MAG: restriction endonuclease subunit S [Microbacteriaceae bacterium]